MIRREVIERVGLLDQTTPMYLEDIDYCRRIADAGWELRFVPEAEITHFWGRSGASERDGDFYAMGCHSIWLYLRKHQSSGAALAFSLAARIAGIARLVPCAAGRLIPGPHRPFARHQFGRALGLCRWAFRMPKTPPRFGFASEPSDELSHSPGGTAA